MAYKILGNIYQIGQGESIATKTGGTIIRRTLVLCQHRFDPSTGEEYEPNYPTFEFTNKGCTLLDGFRQGDRVQVSFDVAGAKYNDKQTGEEKYIVRLRAFNIVPYQQQAQTPQPPLQAAAQPQYQQQYAPQAQYAPQQASPQYQQYVPQQYAPQTDQYGNPLSKDGCPF